jgi:hypothetical protein
MRNRWIDPIFAVVMVLTFSPVIHAQTAGRSRAAKIQGAVPAPDLSGVWANITVQAPTFNPKEDPSFQPWAQAK